jgi:hypothetical protein
MRQLYWLDLSAIFEENSWKPAPGGTGSGSRTSGRSRQSAVYSAKT